MGGGQRKVLGFGKRKKRILIYLAVAARHLCVLLLVQLGTN